MSRTTHYPPAKRFEKLPKEEVLNLMFDLINAFRLVKTPFETALLLQDLLTAGEIRNLARRLRIAKLLIAQESQREIARELRCSLATVTKVSIWLEQGGEGLRNIVSKLPGIYKMPKRLPPGPIEYHLPHLLLGLTQYYLATRETKQLEKFAENVEGKRALDESLQEIFDEEFRNSKNKKSEKL